jgi:hypothetical protein
MRIVGDLHIVVFPGRGEMSLLVFFFNEDGGRNYSSFAKVSQHARGNKAKAASLIYAAVAGARAGSSFVDIVDPNVHIVDELWGDLKDSMKERGVTISRRLITDEERAAAKIKTSRKRYFISAKVKTDQPGVPPPARIPSTAVAASAAAATAPISATAGKKRPATAALPSSRPLKSAAHG